MSLGLAIQQISNYTSIIGTVAEKIANLEGDLISATTNKNDAAIRDIQLRLTTYKTILGLVKDFLEFWKDMIKSILGLLKSFNELAQGAR